MYMSNTLVLTYSFLSSKTVFTKNFLTPSNFKVSSAFLNNFISESSTEQTFTSIEGGANGSELTLLGLNNSVTLQNNSNLILKNNLDVNIPTNASLTLRKINNVWFEVSRSF